MKLTLYASFAPIPLGAEGVRERWLAGSAPVAAIEEKILNGELPMPRSLAEAGRLGLDVRGFQISPWSKAWYLLPHSQEFTQAAVAAGWKIVGGAGIHPCLIPPTMR